MRRLFWLVATVALVPFAGVIYQKLGEQADRRRYRSAGRLVRVGSLSLYVRDAAPEPDIANSSPTIIFESGIGATSQNWTALQQTLAQHVRTLSYDRAGLGWSSSRISTPTPEQLARELRALLSAAGVPPPYFLVAHSFGGFAGSGAADQIHDRLSSVVWLDAFKPKDGEKPLDYISGFSRKALEEAMARGEAGRKPPAAKAYSLVEKEYAWIDSKLTLQPNGPTFQPVHISGKLDTIAKKTYIRAPKYPQASFDRALAECRSDKTWQTFVVEASGHDVMIDKPEWLADILLKVS